MERDTLWYMIGGIVWGAALGFTVAWAVDHRPGAGDTGHAAMAVPSGPMAPTQSGSGGPAAGTAGGGAPMMAEIGALKDRIDGNPGDTAAMVRLGNLYYDVGMWPQAIERYEQAIAAGVDDPAVHTDLGVSFQQAKRFDEALAAFDRAQQVAPQHWQSLFNTAIVAGLDLGRYDVAGAALDKLERFDPRPPRLDELRAEIDRRSGASAGAQP